MSTNTDDEVVAVLRAEMAQWNASLTKAGASLQQFEGKVNKALGAIDDKVGALNFEQVGNKLQGLVGLGKDFVQSWLAAASQTEQFRMTLTALTGSADEAQAMLTKLKTFATTTPFELRDVTQAAVSLRTLGADVDRFLPLAGDLASLFGRTLPDASLALAKALSGSQDGLQILNDSFGITKRELLEAGAHLGNAGAVALETSDDLSALADAIEKVAAKKNFTGAMGQQMETLAGKVSNLSDEWDKFKTGLGESISPIAKDVVSELSGVVGELNNLDAGQKAALATGVLWATGMAGVGSGAIGLVGAFRAAQAALGPLLSSLAVSPWGAFAVAIGVVTTAVFAYKAATEAADAALNEQIKKEWEHVRVLKEKQKLLPGLARVNNGEDVRAVLDKDVDAKTLHKQGLTVKDIDAMIAVKKAELNHAMGERREPVQNQGVMTAAGMAQDTLAGALDPVGLLGLKKKIPNIDTSRKPVENSNPVQVAQAKDSITYLNIRRGELAQVEADEAKSKKSAPSAKDAKKNALSAFDEDRFAIDKAAALGEIDPQEKAKRLVALAKNHGLDKLDPGKFRSLSLDVAEAEGRANKKEDSDAARFLKHQQNEAAKLQRAQDTAEKKRAREEVAAAKRDAAEGKRQDGAENAARREGIELRQGGIDRRISDLNDVHEKTGKTVLPEVKRLLTERLKLEEEAINLEKEQAKAATESADARAQIEENAQEKIQQAREASAKQLKDFTDQEIAEKKRAADAKKRIDDDAKKADEPFFQGPVGSLEEMLKAEKERSAKEEAARQERKQKAEEKRQARQEAITQQNAEEAKRHGKTDESGMTEGERAQAARAAEAEAKHQAETKQRLMAAGKTEEEANRVLGIPPALAAAQTTEAANIAASTAAKKGAQVPSTALKTADGKPSADAAQPQELKLTIEVTAGGDTQSREVTLKGAGGAVAREVQRFTFSNRLGSSV